jgi:hypothetical protein
MSNDQQKDYIIVQVVLQLKTGIKYSCFISEKQIIFII